MAKITETNSENLQEKLEKIIDRTNAQNRLLNKLLEEIKTKESASKNIKEKL